jgi:PilZ domain-containing protein
VQLIDPRRGAPRILVDGFCGLVTRDELRHATLRDLSETGVRLELVFDPATARRTVQLELELPHVDEVVWASADVTFAHLSPLPRHRPDDQPRFLCRAGLRIADISRPERRMLRDYVHWTREHLDWIETLHPMTS